MHKKLQTRLQLAAEAAGPEVYLTFVSQAAKCIYRGAC